MRFEATPEDRATESLARALAGDALSDPSGTERGFVATLAARGLFEVRSAVTAVLAVAAAAESDAGRAELLAGAWLHVDVLAALGEPTSAAVEAVRSGARAGSVALPSKASGEALVGRSRGGAFAVSGSVPRVPLFAESLVTLARDEDGESVVVLVDLDRAPSVASGKPTPGLDGVSRGEVRFAEKDVTAQLAEGAAAGALVRRAVATRRLLTAAIAVGLSRSALDRSLARVRGGARLGQTLEFTLSDMATDVDASLLSALAAAAKRDRGLDPTSDAAVAKRLAAQAATRGVHAALGFPDAATDEWLRRAYLDARSLELMDGSPEELENLIASDLLGES